MKNDPNLISTKEPRTASNYIDQVFGDLLVKSFSHKIVGGNNYWYDCECMHCGRKSKQTTSNLKTYRQKDKGCNCTTDRRLKDLTGMTFGEWEVVSYAGAKEISGYHYTYYLCRCSCGVEREVMSTNLVSGSSTSCGHLRYENRGKNPATEAWMHPDGSQDWMIFNL